MSERRPPLPVMVLAGVAVLFVVLPLAGLLARAHWDTVLTQLGSATVLDALRLSLLTATAALAASLLVGVPLAIVLARVRFPGRSLVRAVVTLPMVLPPVVGGVALLLAFGRNGLLGAPLYSLTGWSLPFTTAGAVVAETFVAMPFLVVAVEAGVHQLDERWEEAAAAMGAGPWARLRRVTLPLVAPSLGAGAALCWARALGEFGATITFAGNLQGRTQTVPLAVYVALEDNPDGAIALALLMVAVSLAVLVLLRHRWLGGT